MSTDRPGDVDDLEPLSRQLKQTISILHDLELAAASVPAEPTPGSESVEGLLSRLVSQYEALEGLGRSTSLSVPQDVVEYIEAGRNPNVYTRQFSEAVTREAQDLKGKMTAFQSFSDILAGAIEDESHGFGPAITADVQRAKQINVDATTTKEVTS